MIIYKITNKLNNKIYIGQTTMSVECRWKDHCRRGFLLTKAIKKHGEENFHCEIIYSCDSISELNAKEIELIALEKCIAPNGYNLSTGGLNYKMHKDTKIKISKIHKGKVLSADTISKLRIYNLGKSLSEETKQKISNSQVGSKRSENTCHNIALSLKIDKRKVLCLNNNISYISAAHAGKLLNLDRCAISKVLSGKRPHHKDYIFIYEAVSAKS